MISIRNVEKFIDDHPEFELDKGTIMKKAEELSHERVLSGGSMGELFGKLELQFFQELHSSKEHLEIAMNDIRGI